MSFTLTLSGNSSILTADYFPPIELKGNYVCGLINFESYNSIPNVDETNKLLHFGDTNVIKIPVGSYEINDINKFIKNYLHNKYGNLIWRDKEVKPEIDIQANNNTLQSEIITQQYILINQIQ